jgi:hypothetical protein
MTHAKGGFYHDIRFVDLAAVVEHYKQFYKLTLSDADKRSHRVSQITVIARR